MLSEKTYTLVCHGCGKIHEKKAEFLSSPLAWELIDANGKKFTVPVMGCGECPPEAISNAYFKGATPEARARAKSEFAKRG